MKRLSGMLAGVALLMSCGTGQAVTVLGGQNWTLAGAPLTLTQAVPTGNQPLNIQCIICGDNQPQQAADFGYTDFKNNGGLSDLAYFSTAVVGGANPGFDTVGLGYDGSFLQNYIALNGAVNLTFAVGIDESFFLLNLTQHKILAAFIGPADIGSQNNGTGFPDFTLEGFDINFGTDFVFGDQLIFDEQFARQKFRLRNAIEAKINDHRRIHSTLAN